MTLAYHPALTSPIYVPDSPKSVVHTRDDLAAAYERYARKAAERHRVPYRDIMRRCRRATVVNARCEVMRRLRHDGYSLPRIGRVMNLHHTSVLNGLRRAGPGLWFADPSPCKIAGEE